MSWAIGNVLQTSHQQHAPSLYIGLINLIFINWLLNAKNGYHHKLLLFSAQVYAFH